MAERVRGQQEEEADLRRRRPPGPDQRGAIKETSPGMTSSLARGAWRLPAIDLHHVVDVAIFSNHQLLLVIPFTIFKLVVVA